jgi:hypothetical protein
MERDEGELVRDIMERRDQKMWGCRRCREDEESKTDREMVWTRNEQMKDIEPVRDITE